MQTLLETDIVKVEFDEEKSIFRHTWNDKTADMSDKKYREQVLQVNGEVEKLEEVKFHLVNTAEFAFRIAPETQEWVAQTVFPPVAAKQGKKVAFIVSSDFFAQVSIEQFTDENPIDIFETKYFDNEEEALKWFEE